MTKKALTVPQNAFLVVLGSTVWNHEPWMDEAQAWLLVQDTTILELFGHYLRYEGSPGLWHLIIMVPAKLGLPYFTLNLVSALISAAGVLLFLYRSPFPFAFKALFPFSYFVLYQYGVVARSYCLIPLLLFLIASTYGKRFDKPGRLIFLLCLFANVSVHGWLAATGIFSVYCLDVVSRWTKLDRKDKGRHLRAWLLYTAMCIALVLLLWPPADHFLNSPGTYSLLHFLNVGSWAIPGALVLDESSAYPLLLRVVSLFIFALTLFWLWQRKLALVYLMPQVAVLALFAVKYRNFWHDGISFFIWIFALWVGMQVKPIRGSQHRHVHSAVLAAATVVLMVQVYWSGFAVTNDLTKQYSASGEVAAYIKEEGLEDRRIFVSGWKNAAVLPHFDRNIFYNYHGQPHRRFWDWSMSNRTALGAGNSVLYQIMVEEPDVVIVSSDHLDGNLGPIDGYSLERVFGGQLFWKTGIYEQNSYAVFLRRSDTEKER